MKDEFFRSSRHELLAAEFPAEVAPWRVPSILRDKPGCTGPCDQGRKECPTVHACLGFGDTQPMEYPPRFDAEGRILLRWMLIGPAIAITVGFIAAFWP